MLAAVDASGDGRISFDEFCLGASLLFTSSEEALRRAFTLCDGNGDVRAHAIHVVRACSQAMWSGHVVGSGEVPHTLQQYPFPFLELNWPHLRRPIWQGRIDQTEFERTLCKLGLEELSRCMPAPPTPSRPTPRHLHHPSPPGPVAANANSHRVWLGREQDRRFPTAVGSPARQLRGRRTNLRRRRYERRQWRHVRRVQGLAHCDGASLLDGDQPLAEAGTVSVRVGGTLLGLGTVAEQSAACSLS